MLDRHAPVLALAVLALAACSFAESESPTEAEDARAPISTASELAEALRDKGAEVEELGEIITAVFSIPGQALRVNGQAVQVYLFADEAAATAEVPELTRSLIHWAAPVRLYQQEALLVLHAAHDTGVATLLEELLGPPVAGAP